MLTNHLRLVASIVLMCLMSLLAAPAGAQITVGGNPGEVDPADPSTWNEDTDAQIGINAGKTGTVTIAGGSAVESGTGFLGYVPLSSGTVTVTGAGSSWSVPYGVYVGCFGGGALNVASGGTVSSSCDYLGLYPGSSGTVTVTGASSSWTNLDELDVGYSGTGALTVASGGTVTTNGIAYLGYDNIASGTVTVTGPGSTWTNNGEFDVGVDGTGMLRVENGGKVISNNLNYECTFLAYSPGSNGTVVVTGAGSSWANHTYPLSVGLRGTGTLRVESGGAVTTVGAYLGQYAGSSGTAIVNGVGSTWACNGDLYLGGYEYTGPGGAGTLRVESGGTATSSASCYFGYNADTSGTATVAGPGSTWTNSAGLYVGYNGTGTLSVENGGTVSSSYGYLGYNAGSSGAATITGAGSTWTNGTLSVGYSGTGTLSVANGGAVNSSAGYIGSPGIGSTATVAGTGSIWTNSGSLYAHSGGTGTLTVSGGGTVTTKTLLASSSDLRGDGTINAKGLVLDLDLVLDAAHGTSQVIPFGTGGALNLNLDGTGDLGAGYCGIGSLRVADGVIASSSHGFLGYNAGANGTATITGPGSTWANSSELRVGYSGTGTLSIDNGGTVSSSAGYLGYNNPSNGTAVISDSGSTWSNSGGLYVGYNGTGTLRVENGGTVTSSTGSIGCNPGFLPVPGGTVIVTGPGSTWTNSGSLYVPGEGYIWNGVTTLTVASGGTVTTGMLYAAGSDLKGNGTINTKGLIAGMALVFDATHGSILSFGTGGRLNLDLDGTGVLGVGYHDTGSLRVADGVKISSSDGYVGYHGTGTAVITGAGSTWSNSAGLHVGYTLGTGILAVGNGGKVTAKSVGIGTGSAVKLHVSGNGMLVVGDAATKGSIGSSGKINLYADAFMAAGTYSPITEYAGRAITWSGSGSYNGFGGTWSNTAKTFTVATATASGSGVSNTLTTGERLLITDSATGQRVGASFGTVANGINFSAAVLSGGGLSGLPADQSVLGAWNFTTNFAGSEALLSFDVGSGQSDLSVWHYNGSVWSAFATPDLTYGSDGIANFSVTAFSGYALTAPHLASPPHAGDANNDGAVDVVDLGILARNYDTTTGMDWPRGDFNGDGGVDVVDLGILARNYDWSAAPAGSIPEPATLSVLALGGLALLRRRSGYAG